MIRNSVSRVLPDCTTDRTNRAIPFHSTDREYGAGCKENGTKRRKPMRFNTGSVGGMIFEDGDNRTSFNYTLRRDCSGTFTAHIGGLGDLHWNIVVSDNGKKILSVIKDPGWVFSGEYSKQ